MSAGPVHARCAGVCAFLLAGLVFIPPSASCAVSSAADIPPTTAPQKPLTIAKELALANNYLFGRGVPQDLKQAAYWLERAADAGNTDARVEMGYFYEAGIGVTRSMEKAAHWYQLAAHDGSADAKASLATLYFWGTGVPENREFAADLYRQAAEKGSGMAAYELGAMYAKGVGVSPDPTAAADWYSKGAKLHNPEAQYELGVLYFNGNGVKLDLRRADDLLRSSVDAGFTPAMFTLGVLLARHPEFAKSPEEAIQLLNVAESAGLWKASEVLGILARDGKGVPQDDKAAYYHFRVAALQDGSEKDTGLQAELQRSTAKLQPASTHALDVQAEQWHDQHSAVLNFVYKNNPRSQYPLSALAAPRDGQHALQLLSALPAEEGSHSDIQSAGATAK